MYCVISAPVQTISGYGSHSRSVVRALIDKYPKWDIKIIPQRWGSTPRNYLLAGRDDDIINKLVTPPLTIQPDVWIQITVPNEFAKVGKYSVGITAGAETTKPPGQFIEGMNRMDLNIAVSEFVKGTFTNNVYDVINKQTQQKMGDLKLTKPIEVIFEGVDTDIYKPVETSPDNKLVQFLDSIDEDFCYLFVGHWLQGGLGHDRKDVGMMIKTFITTFRNKSKSPALILKTSGATFSKIDEYEIIKKINSIREDSELPNIYLLHGDLSEEEINILYNHKKVKAMITTTHGEGFGRPLLEFSLIGKPIIAPNWSGHLDFLKEKYTTLLPGELKNVHPSVGMKDILLPDSKWFYVNHFYFAKALLDMYKNYGKYKDRAKTLKTINTKYYSLSKMNDKIKEVFDKYIPKFPDAMKLKLPKLRKLELPKSTAPSREERETLSKVDPNKVKRLNEGVDSKTNNIDKKKLDTLMSKVK